MEVIRHILKHPTVHKKDSFPQKKFLAHNISSKIEKVCSTAMILTLAEL
jgi:hypothetical protein